MKNICLNIMNKGIAPTELKQKGTLIFHKVTTPMELFAFSKMELSATEILNKLSHQGIKGQKTN